MPYTLIEDFRGGLDVRRDPIAGEPGTCTKLVNAHVTAGGDIETRKSFVPTYTLPAGTFGLHAVGAQLFVFGSDDLSGFPAGVTYQRLQHPAGGIAMTRVADVDSFQGLLYVIADFADGSTHHYYNGVLVQDWESLGADLDTNDKVLQNLAEQLNLSTTFTGAVAGGELTVARTLVGVPFTHEVGVREIGPTTGAKLTVVSKTDPAAAVAGKDATAYFTIVRRYQSNPVYQLTQVSVDTDTGVKNLLSAAVSWVSGMTTTTFATAVVSAINAGTATHGFTAGKGTAGNIVKLTAPTDAWAAANDWDLTVTPNGVDIAGISPTFAGGVNPNPGVKATIVVKVEGSFNGEAEYWVTLDGAKYVARSYSAEFGRIVKSHRSKIYSASESIVYFSAIQQPTKWLDGVGFGYINIANQDTGSEEITAIGLYQGRMAFFSRNSIQVWAIQEDELQNRLIQTLRSTGTISPHAVVEFGGVDTFYLSDSGVRSLRIRDQLDAAFASDIGSPIDAIVSSHVISAGEATVALARAIVEPVEGRLWVALGDKIYVLSYFPAAKVSAWSLYEPGFAVGEMAVAKGRVHVRSGNQVYVYGGLSGTVYPATAEAVAIVRTPFLSFGKPAHLKNEIAFDVACRGAWEMNVLIDPKDETLVYPVGTVSAPTFGHGRINGPSNLTHLALELTCAGGGRVTLSQLAIHYETGAAE